jgi:hypothetical protein
LNFIVYNFMIDSIFIFCKKDRFKKNILQLYTSETLRLYLNEDNYIMHNKSVNLRFGWWMKGEPSRTRRRFLSKSICCFSFSLWPPSPLWSRDEHFLGTEATPAFGYNSYQTKYSMWLWYSKGISNFPSLGSPLI